MDKRGLFIVRNARWRALAGVLFLAFLIRALVPAGYMPSSKADGAGLPGMTFCITGLSMLAADVLGLDAEDGGSKLGPSECALGFTLLLGVFAALAMLAFQRPDARDWTTRFLSFGSLRWWRCPPVGSRAPPN